VTARCSLCAINHPFGYARCQRCGATLEPIQNADPDPDWRERVLQVDEHEPRGELQLRVYRLEQLRELGFAHEWADLLSTQPDVVARARALLAAGCPPATAARILA
jgi:hypothetical protein